MHTDDKGTNLTLFENTSLHTFIHTCLSLNYSQPDLNVLSEVFLFNNENHKDRENLNAKAIDQIITAMRKE